MKLLLSSLAIFTASLLFGQDLTGKWVNTSFSGDENVAYVFDKDGTMTMFYGGKQIETKEPVTYSLKPAGDLYHLEFAYSKKNSSFSAKVLGLVKFKGTDVMEFETFDKKNLPEELDFTKESLMFSRE
ncbi:MAG: hypothetical protein AAGC47_00255 [Bacteroidota bacterium]